MPSKKILQSILLWSLGIAAVAGVLAVLMGGDDVIFRFMFTAGITAIACLLTLKVSKLTDKATSRSAGLLGMWVILVEFIMINLLIWGLDRHWFRGNLDEAVLFSCLSLAWTAPVAMGLLKKFDKPSSRTACLVGLGFCIAHLTFCLLAVWWPDQWPASSTYWRIRSHFWETAWLVFAVGAAVSAALVGLGTDTSRRYWRWAGVGSSVLCFGIGIVGIWQDSDKGPELFTALSGIAVLTAYANIVIRAPLKLSVRWLIPSNIVCMALLMLAIDALVVFDKLTDTNEVIMRVIAAIAIVSACGTLAIAILAGLGRSTDYEPLSKELADIKLTCPRCDKKQTLPLGNSACASCGLRIHTRISEPRCPVCNYLLYKLSSENCPECGTPIQSDPNIQTTNT